MDTDSVLGFRDYLLYSLLYRFGLRIGEALPVNLEDIDLDKELILIHGKGRRNRTLLLVSDIPTLIEKWLCLRRAVNDHPASDILKDLIKRDKITIRVQQARAAPAA